MDQVAQDPALEARVGRLEVDMPDVKSTLDRLEPLIVSIHAQMPYLATKGESERVRGDLAAKIEGVRGDLEAKIERAQGHLEAKIEAVRGDLEAKIVSRTGDLEAKIVGRPGELEAKIEGLRGEVGLAEKPSILGMWMMGATQFALVVAGITAGAAYLPIIARAFHTGP